MTRPVWHAFRCPRCGTRAEVRATIAAPIPPTCSCGRGLTPKQMTPEEAS